MSTHNICFRREIRKILCGYPLLSVAMLRIMKVINFISICVYILLLFVQLLTGILQNCIIKNSD